MDAIDSVILGRIERAINKLPDLITTAVEQAFEKYLVADAEQPEPAAPAEDSEETKAYNAIVYMRVSEMADVIRKSDFDLSNLSWNVLAYILAYQTLSGETIDLGVYPAEFLTTATERSKTIVKNIKTVSSEEIMKYLESKQ